jgi:glutamate synthase (NADPH/NADH) large chain
VHHHLIRKGLRTSVRPRRRDRRAREVHHFALLAGYGAEAINPYLAFETLEHMAPKELSSTPRRPVKRYIKAIGKGMLKVMSKMGISTYQSYCGAQIFDAVGLSSEFVDKYFTGTATTIEGVGLPRSAEERCAASRAFGDDPIYANALDVGGEYAFRIRGEEHMPGRRTVSPSCSTRCAAIRKETYKEFAKLINEQSKRHDHARPVRAQDRPAGKPVPLDEVEPAKEIVKRFATGAMSLRLDLDARRTPRWRSR